MQWNLTSSDLTLRFFELSDNSKPVLSVKMDNTGFVLIRLADQRRSFLIEQRGNYKKRYILRSEYGVKLMELCHEKGFEKNGYLQSEEQRYDYSYTEDKTRAVIKHPAGDRTVSFNIPGTFQSSADSVLLLLAGWYNLKFQRATPDFALASQ